MPGWNVYDNNSNTSDVYGHGTKVAGVIAAGKDIYYGYGRVDAGAAVLAAGDQSGTAPVTDTQAPIVSITSPTGGSVSGTVQVTAAASDDTGVASVAFYIDGVLVASDTSAPYSLAWNSVDHANGAAQFVARAYDSAGNEGISQTVSVNVNNQAPVVDTTPYVCHPRPDA